DTGRGSLIVKPLKHPYITVIMLVRRMEFSLDKKFEMVGILDVPEDRLENRDRSQLLRSMLAESVELELKGVLRKNITVGRWSELSSLSEITAIPEGENLLSVLKEDKELESTIVKGGVELIEVFPRLMPSELLERYLLASGRGLIVNNLVKSYIESPQSVSWIARAHLLYGLPLGKGGIGRAFLAVMSLLKKIEDFTYASLLP
ncbi:MAG: hypothetical protein QXF52_11300, partial [Thermoproteota archaeon]